MGEKSVGKGPNQVTTYSGGKCQCLYTNGIIHTDVHSRQNSNSTDCILRVWACLCVHTHTDTQCSTCQLYFNKIDKTIINPRQVLLAASQTAMATEGLNMED